MPKTAPLYRQDQIPDHPEFAGWISWVHPVSATPGTGMTFIFRLPLARKIVAEAFTLAIPQGMN